MHSPQFSINSKTILKPFPHISMKLHAGHCDYTNAYMYMCIYYAQNWLCAYYQTM